MRRKYGSGKLRKASGSSEEINPLDGVSNLADVMLVFACGLMLALITYWNVDVGQVEQSGAVTPENRQEITEDVSGGSGAGDVDSDGLEQYGTVFVDPETGKLYMVTE